MKVVFAGATKGIGRALARRMAERGNDLFLVGRDVEDLERSARDVEVYGNRPAGTFKVAVCDLAEPDGFDAALDAADEALGGFDTLVVTAGMFSTQDRLEQDSVFTEQMLRANFTGTIMLCEEARRRLLARGGGRCACSRRWRASAAASRWCCTEPRRPACRITWKGSITSSGPKGCGS